MNTTPATGPTDIELYLRATAVPTAYPLRHRLRDYWAGRADSPHLSTAQKEARADEVAENVLLTAWAVARRNEYRASTDLETITHNRIVDPLRIEKAALQARVNRLEDAAKDAHQAATDSAAAPAEDSVPKGPGEQCLGPAALASRRRREKQARDAAASASATAATAAHDAAIERVAVIDERLRQAQGVLSGRVAECRRHTSRRINVYARAIMRRHPDAPVIPALTEHLDLDNDAPRPQSAPQIAAPSGPARLSIVTPEPTTP